jgi:predicted  nucleic acid-binding Zn-ribbon protein
MSTVFEVLLSLREVDAAQLKLEGTISDLRAEEARLRTRLAAEDEAWEKRKREHLELRHRATARAQEVDETDEQIRSYQKKLDEEIIPYKEMEYLREQVEFLRGKLERLEEEALGLMDEVEEDARKLSRDEEEHLARRQRLEEELKALEARRRKLEAERQELVSRREELLSSLPEHLRSHYLRLRESVPDPIVPVENGTCGGCHLRISEHLLEKLREGREVILCENCSRFLYLGWR